jgi:hypothetical protein
LSHKILYDKRLKSYTSLFDGAWAATVLDLSRGTKLDRCVFNLCHNWRALSNVYRVPWFIIHCISGFAVGNMTHQEPIGMALIQGLAERVPAEMGDMTNMQRKKFAEAIRRIGGPIYQALERAKEEQRKELQPESFWRMFLEHYAGHEFGWVIWGSQRVCYGGVYHAYEDFVRECIRTVRGGKKCPLGGGINEIISDVAKHFGKPLADYCLNTPEVNIARLVRNALAHNGGKETDQLKKLPHGIQIEDGVLQIMAPDTKKLFDVLKERAYKLLEKGITLPGMK